MRLVELKKTVEARLEKLDAEAIEIEVSSEWGAREGFLERTARCFFLFFLFFFLNDDKFLFLAEYCHL